MCLVPPIETERLLLRGVLESDIPAYEEHFVDYEVIRHLSDSVPWPYPSGGVADFVRNHILPRQGKDRWMWALCLREDPENLIGALELWREGKPENRGFWLGKRFWGRGYMTEAATVVTDCAFDVLGFERILFSNAAGNVRSRRVKEKTGARLLYVEPAGFVDPVYREHEVWELDKQSWHQWRARDEKA